MNKGPTQVRVQNVHDRDAFRIIATDGVETAMSSDKSLLDGQTWPVRTILSAVNEALENLYITDPLRQPEPLQENHLPK